MNRAAAALLAIALCAVRAGAQDFSPAEGVGPAGSAVALLDRALPAADETAALECGVSRLFALPELECRTLAASLSWGALRMAAGVAQVGEPEFGWNSAAFALGSAGASGGAALRAVARRERAAGALATRQLASGAGFEGGAGAWLAVGAGLRLWAAAPQVVTTGEATPLVRALQLGVRAEGESAAAWAAIDAPSGGRDGGRTLGGELATGPVAAWAEARDGPWRASVGVRARRGALGVALRVDAHPDLPESTFLWLTFSTGQRGRK